MSAEDVYRELCDDILREATVTGESQRACFFEIFSAIAAENGDCPDLTYTPARREGGTPYQVDGYAIDSEQGELFLAVCDLHFEDVPPSLTQAQIDGSFKKLERFYQLAADPAFINSLEEASPAFQAAFPIHEGFRKFRRIRFLLFSNARLAARKKTIESKELNGQTLTYNVLDLSRYADIVSSRSGSEPFELDLAELNGKRTIPCLRAALSGAEAASYLMVIPGGLLATIYGTYGARLLEQNVRTFLQAKTKVNRGIIRTLKETPEMFFAYNNGLTMTSAGVQLGPDGGIVSLLNPQIVNGGQTTASILYARDREKADLSRVFVQAKLTVVEPEAVERVVPLISRYANTQNRISEADLFSSHPFHLEMEKISRRLTAPAKPGALATTKWFYERARGQYKDRQAYLTPAQRAKFLAEFPKEQLFDKPALAKYVVTFDCKPHVVSCGAQRNFMAFAESVASQWQDRPNDFNDDYFRECVAKAIVFRGADQIVAEADWYQRDRGYKANIVTYTVAWIVQHVEKARNACLDLQLIWNRQELPEALRETIAVVAPAVAACLKDPPPAVRNISEYAKQQVCWQAVSRLEVPVPAQLAGVLISAEEARRRRSEGVAERRMTNELELEVTLLKLSQSASSVEKLVRFAAEVRQMTPTLDRAMTKLRRGALNLSAQEKKSVDLLLDRAAADGVDLQEIA